MPPEGYGGVQWVVAHLLALGHEVFLLGAPDSSPFHPRLTIVPAATPEDAAWACDIFVLLVTAVASEDDVRRARGRSNGGDRQEHVDELYKTFAGLPPGRFPLIAAHAAQMVAGDGDERFRFAIDVVVDGVVARAARQ